MSRPQSFRYLLLIVFLILGFVFVFVPAVQAGPVRQIPTVAIPTVTGSPLGPMATVRRDTGEDQINVRAGPGVFFDKIGILIAGQVVPALGRTPGGDWVQISYPGVPGGVGWVYSPNVTIVGNIPIVEPPPTPTPRTTPTIDPSLAAQFIFEIPATRLPTYTEPAALVIPTYPPEYSATSTGRSPVPIGFIIASMGVVGLFGALISLLRGR